MKPRSARSPNAAERRHHDRLREMGCIIHRTPASIHHLRHADGKVITKSHARVMPVCPECHQHGPIAIHRIGQAAWDALHGMDSLAWADEQWDISCEAERG